MVLVQKWPFFSSFFFGNISQENVFYSILKQKNAFVGHKNNKFKKSKNWHFSKGANPWFWSKNGQFSNYFCTQFRPGKVSLRYSRTKKWLSKLKKTRSSKSRKIEIFPKGFTHGFWSKMVIFPIFFFRQYRPGKGLLGYSRTKKRLSKL